MLMIWCYFEVSWEEVEMTYAMMKSYDEKRFKSECEKDDGFLMGEQTVAMKTCSICRRGVRRNSILCVKCKSSVKKCSKI